MYTPTGYQVYLMNEDGAQFERLPVRAAGSSIFSPAWSPDGSKVAFVSPDRQTGNDSIYVVDLGSGELTRITRGAAPARSPTWAPDGRSIAFVQVIGGQSRIYAISADGSGSPDPINHNPPGMDETCPSWGPPEGRGSA
jgi:Tol biopolymer transport system component